MNFTTVFSREYLQNYRQNLQAINLAEAIVRQVLQEAGRSRSRFVYPVNSKKYPIANGEFMEIDKVISILKEKLPNVTVEYQEIQNIHGKIDCGIVIDWS